MNIGDRIRILREQLGMSQDELAQKLGYKSRSSIAKIEKDASGLPQPKILAFANALNTTPTYLMGWEEEIEENPVELAEKHLEMIMDVDLNEIYGEFKRLNPKQKKIVKDLVRSLVDEEP